MNCGNKSLYKILCHTDNLILSQKYDIAKFSYDYEHNYNGLLRLVKSNDKLQLDIDIAICY